jgi:lytic murein transglycosylase
MLFTVLGLTVALTMAACATMEVARQEIPAATGQGPSGQGLSFPDWVREFRGYALAQGISPATFDAAFAAVRYNPRITASNENQPEFSRAFWDYVDRAVSQTRIATGRQKLAQHRALLAEMEENYGVRAAIVAAIWGMESGYGANLGSTNVIEALATLAYQGNRTSFGREQLLAALRILEQKDIPPQRMTGSWAGAMGHTQFIPTTFLSYAIDHDGDGRRNIWDSMGDVFASTANYLEKKGWERGQPCFMEVKLPPGFKYEDADIDVVQPLEDWAKSGVKRIDGRPLLSGRAAADADSSILTPTGHKGPAFVVFANFRAVLRYNQAQTYALSVCLLADAIEGAGGIVAPWPKADPPVLAFADRVELQTLLNRLGHDAGQPDGVLGRKTRAAVRAFQAANGLVPDGYATQSLLQQVRARQA